MEKDYQEYSTLETTYFDEFDKCYCVDAWIGDEDQGKVLAKVYETGRIEWCDDDATHSPQVILVIADLIREKIKC